MSGASKNQHPRQGFCAAHRVLFVWQGKLVQRDAFCSVVDGNGLACGLPLVTKPRNVGPYRIEQRTPGTRVIAGAEVSNG